MKTIDTAPSSAPMMVIHGPSVFDEGDAAWLMDRIQPSRMVVTGVMARTAAEESGLPVRCCEDPPSIVMARVHDKAFLVNHGKSPESGHIFGELVAGRLGSHRGLIHVECSSRTVYVWNNGNQDLARKIAGYTGFRLAAAAAAPPQSNRCRVIRGCRLGEWVFVNGIVIGTATAGEVVLREEADGIRPVSGIETKAHGLEKLERTGPVNLAAAWCKSGMLRFKEPLPQGAALREGRILVIDHCGHEIYRRLDGSVCGVLSIGDDTTAVCGHICTHLGLPIFGIVDGDCDGIVAGTYPPGSVVVEVIDGRDDDVGEQVAGGIDGRPWSWRSWVARTLEELGDQVRIVHNTLDLHESLC